MLLARFVAGLLPVSLMVLSAGVVSGQDYPNKPIRIVTSQISGGSDFTARQIAQGISGAWGQQVIVDNRVELIGAEAVSKAPPDGYTLLVAGRSLWIRAFLQRVPYDAVRDFSPISLTDRQVSVVAVHPSLPVKSVKELIALAKARPGELNYASGSTGGATHLAVELFKSMAGVSIVRVSYSSSSAQYSDLISGQVQMTIADTGVVMPHIKSGKLRALAVSSAEPSAMAPGLPTVAASGLPGYESVGLTGIWAPAKTPGVIITRLNQEIVRLLNLPDTKERFFKAGAETVGSAPEQFATTIKSDMATMGKVVKDAGIKVD